MEQLIITEKLFKDSGPIKEDVIVSKFVPYISLAQALRIEPILGKALLEELQEQIKTDTLTPLNSALILKIAPALTFYSIYQGLPFHWAAIQNKGVTVRESENSKAVDGDGLAQQRRYVLDDAQAFARRLIDYLCECKEDYPLWRPDRGCGCPGTGEGSHDVRANAGIFFKRKGGHRYGR